ncbi:hypothetical protein IOD13_00845 [Brevibacterium casei]|nr:hypothetical protein [Brevibacterium casei]
MGPFLSHAEDIAELSAIRGSTIPATYAHVTAAMTLVHGPQFYARRLAGEFTIEHAIAATRMCQDLQLQRLPVIDCYLEERRADITVETFRKSLSLKVSIVQPEEERTEAAHERRRVGITTFPRRHRVPDAHRTVSRTSSVLPAHRGLRESHPQRQHCGVHRPDARRSDHRRRPQRSTP